MDERLERAARPHSPELVPGDGIREEPLLEHVDMPPQRPEHYVDGPDLDCSVWIWQRLQYLCAIL